MNLASCPLEQMCVSSAPACLSLNLKTSPSALLYEAKILLQDDDVKKDSAVPLVNLCLSVTLETSRPVVAHKKNIF